MDEHNKVRVTMNQQSNYNKKHDLENFLTPKNKQHSYSLTFRGRSMFGKMVKPILLAVLLGGIFGAGLIYFFSDLTPDAVPVTSVDDDEEVQDQTNDEVRTGELKLPGNTFEVIQFGLFSTEENANDLNETLLIPNSIPAVVQEQSGQFFVISHVITSEIEKESITNFLESKGLVYMTDFFYKKWNYSTSTVAVSDEEKNWLNEGLTILNEYSNSANNRNWMNQTQEWLNDTKESYQNNDHINNMRENLTNFQNTTNENIQQFHERNTLLNLYLFFANLN
ncbi:hypothetical protein E3U55_00670 [Filobacillus milosensis]|uniref:SPOR domain-containing protein n=1 Tax=Filobacillus milosensis TaxID=94137 RepID=A0A4Y8IVG0_9BACI|nr:hypothetical protein [Filobacillus milosensis]TFB24937.1 hypothetical protein E3U55_00670 [Filobacillus milosensis]